MEPRCEKEYAKGLAKLSQVLADPSCSPEFRLHGVLSSGHRLHGAPEDLTSAVTTAKLLVHGGISTIPPRGRLLDCDDPARFRHVEVLDPDVARPFIAAAYQIVGVPGGDQEDFFLAPSALAGLDPDHPEVDPEDLVLDPEPLWR